METAKEIIHAYVLKCERERETGRYEEAERNSEQGRGPVSSRSEVGFTKSMVSLWGRIQSKAIVDPDYAAACQRSWERELNGHPLSGD